MNFSSQRRCEAIKAVEEFCLSNKCRRGTVLRHFGETAACSLGCDICKDPLGVAKLRRLAESNLEESMYEPLQVERKGSLHSDRSAVPAHGIDKKQNPLGRKDTNISKPAGKQTKIDTFFSAPQTSSTSFKYVLSCKLNTISSLTWKLFTRLTP